MTTRPVWYVAAPLRPIIADLDRVLADLRETNQTATTDAVMQMALDANIDRAGRWLQWLRKTNPEVTFVAPWIASVLTGEDDRDPAQRAAGLEDARAVIPRLTGVVLVGGRVSGGMTDERSVAQRVVDLTGLGLEPPTDGAYHVDWAEVP